MNNKYITESVSFHVIKPCNMKCKFCYATFNDFTVDKQLTLEQAKEIIDKLISNGLQKITFAGGEPMLWKPLTHAIIYAKSKGLTTSIITNGSLITKQWLQIVEKHLDWIGVSIDSINDKTNINIGRTAKFTLGISDKPEYYKGLIYTIRRFNFKLKINTVVNTYNKNEDFNELINYAKPDRWKVFQALPVEGQNDEQFNEIKITSEEFNTFINKHEKLNPIVENNEAMLNSYLLIDPLGRFFEGGKKHKYSKSIINNDINECLNEISHDKDMFIKRGGLYNW